MIKVDENLIVGSWTLRNGKVKADSNCSRIEDLIQNYLVKIQSDRTGWLTLYLDNNTNQYWELSYPQGDMHGGGPPKLEKVLNETELKMKYDLT